MSPNQGPRWTTWDTISSGFREIELRGDRLESVGLVAPCVAPSELELVIGQSPPRVLSVTRPGINHRRRGRCGQPVSTRRDAGRLLVARTSAGLESTAPRPG